MKKSISELVNKYTDEGRSVKVGAWLNGKQCMISHGRFALTIDGNVTLFESKDYR